MEQQSTFFKSDVIARRPKADEAIRIHGLLRPLRQAQGPHNDNIVDLGLTCYEQVLELQQKLSQEIALNNRKELIIITEHFPVYTCGRSTKPHERPLNSEIPVVDIERGGGLTYHGPGQIVGYPILNLNRRKLSIPNYLRSLENALISVLAELGVEAHYREACLAGVWVGEKKLISIGIAVRRWVTFHGFALNVDCDLTPFRMARPCGMSGDKVTSLKELGYEITKEKLILNIKEALLKTFF